METSLRSLFRAGCAFARVSGLIAVLFTVVPPAAGITLFRTSFEAGEGYSGESKLVGQNGWLGAGDGGDGIVTDFFPNQPHSAFLGFVPPSNGGDFHAVGYHVDFDPIQRQLPRVTFSVQMAAYTASTNGPGGWFDWSAFNTEGKFLFGLEFPCGTGSQAVYYKLGGADYQVTGQSFSNGVPYALKVVMDFSANRWSASLDASILVTNQPIAAANTLLTLGNIDAQWSLRDPARPSDEFLVFDKYELVAEPPPTPGLETLYFTSFEAVEGYQSSLRLVGQNGWLGAGSGGDGIVTNFFPNQPQSAFLGFIAPTNGSFHAVGNHPNFDPLARGLPVVNFSVLMAVYPSQTNNQDWFDWAFFNIDGAFLFALEFPTGTGGQPVYYKLGEGDYVPTGQNYTNSTAYTLTVTMNFASNLWSARLDSTVLVTNLPIRSGTNALNLGAIDAQWALREAARPGDDFLVFDEFQIRAEALSPVPAPGPALQIKSRLPNGNTVVQVTGQPGISYALDATADLKAWAQLATVSSPTGVSEYTDTTGAGVVRRFYRARSVSAGAAPEQ